MSNIDWRRVYAGQAMQGLISVANWSGTMSDEAMRDIAEKSVKQAGYMIDALQGENDPLDTKIDDLEFTVRTANCLRAANIETVRELATCNAQFLLRIPFFGAKCLNEVRGALALFGESLHD